MTHLRHWVITAALLSIAHSGGLGAEPLEGLDLAGKRDPAGSSLIQDKAANSRPGLMDVVLASYAVQSHQRMEIGLGLGNDTRVNGAMGWDGVYAKNLDRIAERNNNYGLLSDTPRPGFTGSTALTALCCTRSDALVPPGQIASSTASRQLSQNFYLFGMLRKKGLNINFEDGWKLQAGVRPMQYNSVLQTKVRFITVERYWESFRTSFSFELERTDGVSAAPSHVLQLDYLYSPRNSVGVSFTNGREVAYFGPLSILNTEVHGVALRGQHWFKQDWALTFQAGYNDHGSLPAQTGIRAGLRHIF